VEDDVTEVSKGSSNHSTRPLTNEWTKVKLIYDLAIDEKTQRDLAEDYGVSQPAITKFKKRHQEAIEARREKLLEEYAALWVAEKYNRLATRQTEIEELMDQKTSARNAEVIDRLLNSVAEELGELQTKLAIEVAEYRITGIDIDKV